MPFIDVNFDDVPDNIQPIPAGLYILTIKEADVKPSKDEKSKNLILKLKVDDPSNPNHDRQIVDYCNLGNNDFAKVRLKRLQKSAGLVPGKGLNTDDLVGKTVKARISTAPFTNKDTGEVSERSNIAEYMF